MLLLLSETIGFGLHNKKNRKPKMIVNDFERFSKFFFMHRYVSIENFLVRQLFYVILDNDDSVCDFWLLYWIRKKYNEMINRGMNAWIWLWLKLGLLKFEIWLDLITEIDG